MPSPINVDFQILDDATDQPISGRLLVVGTHPAFSTSECSRRRTGTDAINDEDSLDALLGGDFDTIRNVMTGKGIPATAFTAPVFVDFDGGGYRAPFAP